MSILALVIVVLIVAMLPTWGYSSGWGYWPSGGGLILLVIVLFFLFGHR